MQLRSNLIKFIRVKEMFLKDLLEPQALCKSVVSHLFVPSGTWVLWNRAWKTQNQYINYLGDDTLSTVWSEYWYFNKQDQVGKAVHSTAGREVLVGVTVAQPVVSLQKH